MEGPTLDKTYPVVGPATAGLPFNIFTEFLFYLFRIVVFFLLT